MKLQRQNQVFNLYNTNGRRADIIEAYTIYLEILKDLQKHKDYEWSSFPKSLNQFKFYKEAINRSPNTFKNHPKYDRFNTYLQKKEYNNAFFNLDKDKFNLLEHGDSLLTDLGSGIEDRARHYTSNLDKIGFTYSNRDITPVGKAYLNPEGLKRSLFEEILPINNTNLILLQQILKLRVYNSDNSRFYSPALMCFYILLNNKIVNAKDCLNLIQLLTPEKAVDPNDLLDTINDFSVLAFARSYIDISEDKSYQYISNYSDLMSKSKFNKYYKNRKSSKPVNYYYDFYKALYKFIKNKNQDNLDVLYEVYYKNAKRRQQLNKAFGFGKNIFSMRNFQDIKKFLIDNSNNVFLNSNNFNKVFYEEYFRSKHYDQVDENSDTLKRLLEATGVISTSNGIMGIEYHDVWKDLFDKFDFETNIFVKVNKENYKNYEKNVRSFFFLQTSIENILNYSDETTNQILSSILKDYKANSIQETRETLKNQINSKFVAFIEENYPRKKVEELLSMFLDRSNDEKIKSFTGSTARIPTIFEYVVGIAWYYISDEKYNVFDSFNLTMTTDFIPVTHAAGGQGDIVVRYDDYLIMIEVTLLDTHGQRRNELEPVSRHTVNLTAESLPKQVYTIYIADELDNNTVSNWRAQAYYSQESTSGDAIEVEGVSILPVTLDEYKHFFKKQVSSSQIIKELNKSINENELGHQWRNQLISDLLL